MITMLGAPLLADSSSGHQGWESRYVLPIDPLKRFSLCDTLPSPFGGSSHCLRCSQTLNCSSAPAHALSIVQFKYRCCMNVAHKARRKFFFGNLLRSESLSLDV